MLGTSTRDLQNGPMRSRSRRGLAAAVVLAGATLALLGVLRADRDPGAAMRPAASIEQPRKPAALAASCTPGSTVRLGSAAGGVAVLVVRPTTARRSPGGAPVARFGLENVNGVRTVFGALSAKVDRACRAEWYRVQLPLRPNGATGWVKATDVVRYAVGTRVLVDLSARRVTLFRGERRVMNVRASIGKSSTPTPTGRFYVNQRLLAANPSGVFGPGGVGISAFSPVLVDWAQGGPIAIHGTNRPDLIGQAVSNGCLRIRNTQLLRLLELAPEGTPVEIRA